MPHNHQPLYTLLDAFQKGRLSRRELLRRAAALGVSLPVLAALLRNPVLAWQADPVPPRAKRVRQVMDFDGVLVGDPYAWLEDATDPEVISYLEAENAYTEAVMAPTEQLRESLYEEIIGRIQQTDTSVPYRLSDYYYYSRTEEGRDYAILCRKKGSLDAPEEILLDINEIAGDQLSFGGFAPSPDHRLLAYAINHTGGLEYTLYFKDLATGDLLPDQLPTSDLVWGSDNRTVYYTRLDETLRPFELYRHVLGTDPATDAMLLREVDPELFLGIGTSKDKEFLFVASSGYDSSEIRYRRMDQSDADFALFAPIQAGVEYWLEHFDDEFLVLTNKDAINFTLLAVPVADPSPENGRVLIPHRESVLLEGASPFAGHFLISGREDGLTRLWIYDVATGVMEPVSFDEPVHTVGEAYNPEFDTTKATIAYTSFVTPYTWYELDLETGERTLIKQEEVVGGFDPDAYISERLFATAADGAMIPVSILRRRDAGGGPHPMLLYGYGAYGLTFDPFFATNQLSLIDRGFTYGIAHVRGGEEMGRSWYENGKLLHKKNTFTDFIACAEHLIAEGYTASDQLVAWGGSAGGMLMGVLANERPDLFRLIVAEVPFVDVLRVMLDPTQPLTTAEYVEWGNPAEPTFYDYIRSYSPYDNVARHDYPTLFITGSLEDDLVPYWQPAKWTAKLRASKSDDNLLLLRTNLGAGHSGESGFYDAQGEVAFIYAFILSSLGMTDNELPTAAKGLATPRAARRASSTVVMA